MSDSRTIHVTGKGNISVKPDATRLKISIEGVEREYGLAVKKSAELTEELRSEIVKLGFAGSDLRTVSFDVSKKTESYCDKNDNYRTRFVGYEFSHEMKLEFFSDNERLGKILYTLGHSPAHPEFSIDYYVSDPETAKNELLSRAVKDAKMKADVIATASGVKLGKITYIDYSWGEIRLDYQPVQRLDSSIMYESESVGSAYNMDMEPDDIDASDTVTITWEIE